MTTPSSSPANSVDRTEGLDWCGLPAWVDGHGCVHVSTGRREARVRVELPAPWQVRGSARVDVDTVELDWAAPGARARVRVVLGDVCHVEVVEQHEQVTELPVPLLVLDVDRLAPPAWLLGAGALGRAALGVPGGVLHLRQQLGDCSLHRLDEATRAVAMLPGGAWQGTARARWRCELVSGWRDVGSLLPSWLPDADVFDVGERLLVPLPDAAVTSDAAECRSLGDATEVTIVTGRQQLTVAEAAGAVRLTLAGVRGDRDDLLLRAQRILDTADTRQLHGAQLWLVLHARMELDAEDFLASGAEELAGQLRHAAGPDPFAVAAVAGWSASVGDVDGVDAARVASSRWAPMGPEEVPPGARLAVAWVHMAARTLSLEPPHQLSVPPPGSLAELEHALVTMDQQAARRALEHWSDALGGGLPGCSTRPEAAAVAAALLRRMPPGWLPPELAGLLPVWERRLRASCDRIAAWLHW